MKAKAEVLAKRKSIPLFSQGPDPTRCYARDHNRWSIVEGTGKDDFIAKVYTKKGWGRAETLGISLIPLATFVLFGSIGAWMFLSDQGNSLELFLWLILICLGLVVLFAFLICSEVNYFNQFPSSPLTVFENGEFSIGDDKCRISLPAGSIFRYTLHHPIPGTQGASTHSELDLVLRDGGEVIAVHKIMAHQNNWCWRHARLLSRLSSIPLQRIALQADGTLFPPALPN